MNCPRWCCLWLWESWSPCIADPDRRREPLGPAGRPLRWRRTMPSWQQYRRGSDNGTRSRSMVGVVSGVFETAAASSPPPRPQMPRYRIWRGRWMTRPTGVGLPRRRRNGPDGRRRVRGRRLPNRRRGAGQCAWATFRWLPCSQISPPRD